jgi:universal stress protein A
MSPTTDAYRHILFATDFGPAARSIGARAVELARRYDARLSLVHVVEYVPLDFSGDFGIPPPVEVETELQARSRERLAELATQLGAADAGRFVEVGTTKHEILRLAQTEAVDLIVLGSHGRSGLGLLLGSTANAVLHGAACDVLAVRVRE